MIGNCLGEALGAIGGPESLEVLEQYVSDSAVEVSETCELAVDRIKWLHAAGEREREELLQRSPYLSVGEQ